MLDVSGGLCFYTRKGFTPKRVYFVLSQAVKQAVDISGHRRWRRHHAARLGAAPREADAPIGVGRASCKAELGPKAV